MSEQIKYANLIFVEHSKLLKENKLLYKQLDNYKESNKILTEIDSIKNVQMTDLYNTNLDYSEKMINLNESIRKEKQSLKTWQIGSITISACLLIFLLIK